MGTAVGQPQGTSIMERRMQSLEMLVVSGRRGWHSEGVDERLTAAGRRRV